MSSSRIASKAKKQGQDFLNSSAERAMWQVSLILRDIATNPSDVDVGICQSQVTGAEHERPQTKVSSRR